MQNLLVAVDFSACTDALLKEAETLASKLEAKLWILHVSTDETASMALNSTFSDYAPEVASMPGDVQLARDISAEELKREHRQLLAISGEMRNRGIETRALLVRGNPAAEILEKAAEIQPGMIILGSHGHGLFHKALLGSVSESVIHHAAHNVLIVPHAEKTA